LLSPSQLLTIQLHFFERYTLDEIAERLEKLETTTLSAWLFGLHTSKKGPDAWVYRWRDIDSKGKPKMRALVIGTVKEYPTETAAWKAVSTLRLEINHRISRPEAMPKTFEELVQHYRMIELDLEKQSERKGYQTRQVYEICLRTHILPRWGEYRLREITAVAVERWLGGINLANATKSKFKYVMSDVYQHGIRYGWLTSEENPVLAVRQSAKRERVTEPLEAPEFRALMRKLPHKVRVIGIVAATTRLRISEVLG
jgi:integrase